MYILYDLLLFIYALVYLPYLLLTKRWFPDLWSRLGIWGPELKKQIKARPNIWIHAVSVGEIMAIDGFVDLLKKSYPGRQLVVTCTTKTGYKLACANLGSRAVVVPSPIDLSFVVRRFVSLIAPQLYIAVETEIWPNLYRQLNALQVPVAVINGRISDNSWGRYKAVRFLLKQTLDQVSQWCMQSQEHAHRIIGLGADPSRVVVTGNIKFDEMISVIPSSAGGAVSTREELVWVAGSTHPGEEKIILDVYSKVLAQDPRWQLVIAPRHIERTPEIMALVKGHNYQPVKFSEVAATRGEDKRTIIVVDTIGQLRSLYARASLVFVGKSLCVGGGHNIIEPAFYGKAIIVGPKCANFKDIVASFLEADALVQVKDAQSFEDAVMELCRDTAKRQALGAAAKKVITVNQGATARNLELLTGLLK